MKQLVYLLLAVLLTTGCSNDDTPQETVLQPIGENIVGKWQMTGYSTFSDGKWEEQINDNNVSMAMDFRPDGTEVRVMTYPDGFTALATRTWSVDEANNMLTDEGSQQKIHRLTATELVTESTQAQDPETGEIAQTIGRWTFCRATEKDKTLAERLVGKWRFTGVYDKVDGQWVARNEDRFDEFWVEYKENGMSEEHAFRDGEEFHHTECKWSANTAAKRLRITEPDFEQPIEMPDENTLVCYFESDNGEYILKDVYVRISDF